MSDKKSVSMSAYSYLGAVIYQGKWRFFYHEGSRYKWALDLRNVDETILPQQGRNFLTVTIENIEEYCASFDHELTASQIRNYVKKVNLTFIVNFDQSTFIDGGGEEGEYLSISDFIPKEWRFILVSDLAYYLPSVVRVLWLNKHSLYDENSSIPFTGIYKWAQIGAIKYQSQWRFYFEQFGMWQLNFLTFMEKINRHNWLTDPIYEDWRKNLPYVSEANAEDYIQALTPYELEKDEITRLKYILMDDEVEMHQFNLEIWEVVQLEKMGLLNIPKPSLDFIINFDEQVYVRRAYDPKQISFNINPKEVFAPEHWTCHQDEPLHHLPKDYSRLFR